jgi:hypothetical protein
MAAIDVVVLSCVYLQRRWVVFAGVWLEVRLAPDVYRRDQPINDFFFFLIITTQQRCAVRTVPKHPVAERKTRHENITATTSRHVEENDRPVVVQLHLQEPKK